MNSIKHCGVKCIFVFSGKRKSGKDFLTEILKTRLGENRTAILRLSAPLKNAYAVEHDLDFSKLLDTSEYKEKYRKDMILWGEKRRNEDPGYFAKIITTSPEAMEKSVWIISDARRRSDVCWFQENYGDKVVLVRVEADADVRKQRGWTFTQGVDDVESECGLDTGVTFDYTITNNGTLDDIEHDLEELVKRGGDSQ